MTDAKPILLVDDDRVDVMIVKRILKELGVVNRLVHELDGTAALAYLEDANRARPCVILLDLNMPRMDGLEFLHIVKTNDALKDVPVVVLTTSNDERDMMQSFEWGAVAYVHKCLDYTVYRETLRAIERYVVSVRPSEDLDRARR